MWDAQTYLGARSTGGSGDVMWMGCSSRGWRPLGLWWLSAGGRQALGLLELALIIVVGDTHRAGRVGSGGVGPGVVAQGAQSVVAAAGEFAGHRERGALGAEPWRRAG